MKIITTNKGIDTMVDDEDFPLLQPFSWFLNNRGYVYYRSGKKTILIHRLIMSVHEAGRNIQVDHKDNNPLNNQKDNLRICSGFQNQRNRKEGKGVSKFIGVDYSKEKELWRSRISIDGNQINLGLYNSEFDAAVVRDNYIRQNNDPFAKLNFPDKDYSLFIIKTPTDSFNRTFIGVFQCFGKWRGRVINKGKQWWSISYPTEIEAAIARDEYIIANNIPSKLNFPRR